MLDGRCLPVIRAAPAREIAVMRHAADTNGRLVMPDGKAWADQPNHRIAVGSGAETA